MFNHSFLFLFDPDIYQRWKSQSQSSLHSQRQAIWNLKHLQALFVDKTLWHESRATVRTSKMLLGICGTFEFVENKWSFLIGCGNILGIIFSYFGFFFSMVNKNKNNSPQKNTPPFWFSGAVMHQIPENYPKVLRSVWSKGDWRTWQR